MRRSRRFGFQLALVALALVLLGCDKRPGTTGTVGPPTKGGASAAPAGDRAPSPAKVDPAGPR